MKLNHQICFSCFVTLREPTLNVNLIYSFSDPLLDTNLASSNLLFVSLLEKNLSDSSSLETASEIFDIYHDNNIAEVKKLMGLLGKFSSRATELLEEFPEHPALFQVTTPSITPINPR